VSKDCVTSACAGDEDGGMGGHFGVGGWSCYKSGEKWDFSIYGSMR
jgi:hypothetical protein